MPMDGEDSDSRLLPGGALVGGDAIARTGWKGNPVGGDGDRVQPIADGPFVGFRLSGGGMNGNGQQEGGEEQAERVHKAGNS